MRRIISAFFCSLFICSCTVFAPVPVKKSEYLLGTIVSITVYDNINNAEKLINECFSLVRSLEKKVSFTDENSELSYINSKAYESPVHISDEMFDILNKSLEFCEKSEGSFDIGLGKLIELWAIGTDNAQVPSDDELSALKGFKAYKNIVIDSEQKTVSFTDERVKLNLGACAKGYAEDMAVEFLKEKGICSALLNFGGSVSVIGKKPDGSEFAIGVTNPINESEFIRTISVSDMSVVTSGDYQRYFVENGIEYHHILDSATGYPSKNGINSVTIVCESAFAADCLSTAAFVLGVDKAEKLILAENCEYIICADEVLSSDGVKFSA